MIKENYNLLIFSKMKMNKALIQTMKIFQVINILRPLNKIISNNGVLKSLKQRGYLIFNMTIDAWMKLFF